MALADIIPFDTFTRAEGQNGRGFAATHMRADLVEQASKLVPHPPVLINMVSQRVRQLNQGRPPLIDLIGRRKLGQADIALLEIIEGKVVRTMPDGIEPEKPARKKK
jgi:DNA-directed RNA polymerase subunit omega